MPPRIFVAPILTPPPDLVAAAVARIGRVFSLPVEVFVADIDARSTFDERRGQYNSTLLLTELLRVLPQQEAKIIGLTSVDLFIPILTFVFGEAQLDGPTAVASCHRLSNRYYGLPDSQELLTDRFQKECLHELGHTFNLIHCDSFDCVMHSSTSAEEIDIKGNTFCPRCRSQIGL